MINDSVAAKGLHCDRRDIYRTWPGIARTNSGHGVGPARCAAGFHLTKKACSVLITTLLLGKAGLIPLLCTTHPPPLAPPTEGGEGLGSAEVYSPWMGEA